MKIETIMTRRVVTVGMDATLDVIHQVFERKRFRHLLVTESNRLIGVISDRDLLKELSPNVLRGVPTERESFQLRRHAHQIMTRNPFCLGKDAKLKEAINLFLQKKISCIPVVIRRQLTCPV